MVTDPNETDEAVGRRMRLLRRTIKPGMSIKDYAEQFLKVGYVRYFNVENGLPMSRTLAGIIRKKVQGISTDWMYYGDTRGVHLELLQALSERAEADEENGNTTAGA